MNVLAIATNFPDPIHRTWAPWNKSSIDAIASQDNVTTIVPRPIAPPMTTYYTIPRVEITQLYTIHYMRFPYLLPKKLFYGLTGDLFKYSVSKYIAKSLTDKTIERPEVIHSFHPYPDGYGMTDISKALNVPHVITVHSRRNVEYCTAKVVRALIRASKIITVSESLVPLINSLGIPLENIAHVSLGVNPNEFKPIERTKSKVVVPKYGIGDERIVLFVGQLLPIKNIKAIIESIPYVTNRLKGNKSKVRFIIVGDGPERMKMEGLASNLKVTEYITFTGRIPFGDLELKEWYGISDIFVLPSFSEGKPVAIFEAMSGGCAIISSNVDGIPEQVKNGVNGYLIDPTTPGDFAKKLLLLLSKDDVLENMKKESRRILFDLGYTWDHYQKRVRSVYEQF